MVIGGECLEWYRMSVHANSRRREERGGERCKKGNAGCNERKVEGCDMNFHCLGNFTACTVHWLMY